MAYKLSWKKHTLIVTHHGLVTSGSIIAALDSMVGHEYFDSLRSVITDFSMADELGVSEVDIDRIVSISYALSLSNNRIRSAIVANQESAKALSNLFIEIAARLPWERKLFINIDDAKAWLDE